MGNKVRIAKTSRNSEYKISNGRCKHKHYHSICMCLMYKNLYQNEFQKELLSIKNVFIKEIDSVKLHQLECDFSVVGQDKT